MKNCCHNCGEEPGIIVGFPIEKQFNYKCSRCGHIYVYNNSISCFRGSCIDWMVKNANLYYSNREMEEE